MWKLQRGSYFNPKKNLSYIKFLYIQQTISATFHKKAKNSLLEIINFFAVYIFLIKKSCSFHAGEF